MLRSPNVHHNADRLLGIRNWWCTRKSHQPLQWIEGQADLVNIKWCDHIFEYFWAKANAETLRCSMLGHLGIFFAWWQNF